MSVPLGSSLGEEYGARGKSRNTAPATALPPQLKRRPSSLVTAQRNHNTALSRFVDKMTRTATAAVETMTAMTTGGFGSGEERSVEEDRALARLKRAATSPRLTVGADHCAWTAASSSEDGAGDDLPGAVNRLRESFDSESGGRFGTGSEATTGVRRASGVSLQSDSVRKRMVKVQSQATTIAVYEEEEACRARARREREAAMDRRRSVETVAHSIFTVSGPTKTRLFRFNSRFSRINSILLLFAALWTIGFVPFHVAFDRRQRMGTGLLVSNLIVDIYYLFFGIGMRFNTSICDLTYGKEWTDRAAIHRYILKDPFFWMDVASVAPLMLQPMPPSVNFLGESQAVRDAEYADGLQALDGLGSAQPLSLGPEVQGPEVQGFIQSGHAKVPNTVGNGAVSMPEPYPSSLSIFSKMLELLKILRFYRMIRIPTSHLEAEYSVLVHILRVFLWVFLICHFLGCMWFLILEVDGTTALHLMSDDVRVPTNVGSWYLFAFRDGVYILLGRVRPAFGDTEMLLLSIVGPLGGFFFAVISANCTVLLSRLDAVARKHHEQMCFIRSAMKSLNLPANLRMRIEKYHLFLAIHHNLNAYNSLFQGLSVQLFTELKAQIYDRLFRDAPVYLGVVRGSCAGCFLLRRQSSRMPCANDLNSSFSNLKTPQFFRNAPEEFINSIVLALEETTFSPGETVLLRGEIGNEMYWILRGRCDVVDSSGIRVVATLCENNFFGEVLLRLGEVFQRSRRGKGRYNADFYS